ncbi:MAG: hypothetical protein PVI90_11000 [Desulfobacteraceae bacterium]|jgi:hypothetical protein
MKWFEPQNTKDWIQRGLSLRLGLMLVITLLLVITELQFNWLEKVIGNYLITTNADRPESGAIWELGHQTQTARKDLAKIVSGNQSSQKEARNADSFSQVLSGLSEDNGISISSAHFRTLYDKLPVVLSQELLSPYSLLQLESQGKWVRTYFSKGENGIRIYLLDNGNQVLKEVVVAQDLADYIKKGEVAITGSLDSFADFSGYIYQPDMFFKALEELPENVRRGIISQPEMLLSTKGKLLNVGISSEQVGGSIAIGFEYEQAEGHKVVLVQGNEKDVEQLRSRLSKLKNSDPSSSSDYNN